MDANEAKEIIKVGFAWANWTDEQKQAFKLAYEALDKVESAKEIFKDIEKVQTWDEWKDKNLSKRVIDFINN